ncbi:MAG: hypothetical protein K0Q66_1921, partial [Chitinophagaceae bacterium]|nr:hypothetical protein [Chitinophagaceae bacterium]
MPKRDLRPFILVAILLSCSWNSFSQLLTGSVKDTAGNPVAFATIRLGETNKGLVADLEGKFKVRVSPATTITVSHLGFVTRKIALSTVDSSTHLDIILQPASALLDEVVVSSTTNKLRRILNNVLANRNRNNPDKYDWYQCNVYYKTTMDFVLPDSVTPKDTSQDQREFRDFTERQHMFMTETFSRRTWERPQKLQEDVIATRMSGFKKALFTSLVTDVLPFHAYNDYLTLNGRDYHSPVSSGLHQRFAFRLEDEFQQDRDTIWIISFKPKNDPENLSGSLYISSRYFAIAQLIAQFKDPVLDRVVGIEQQYRLEEDKWFPHQLNYFIRWDNIMGTRQGMSMKGISLVDSVSFARSDFKFDRAHSTRLMPGADALKDTAWVALRPAPLTEKDKRTYIVLDSLGDEHNFDRIGSYFEQLVDGFFPLGPVDLDLQRIYSFNNYEKHRLGFGLRTSNKLSPRFNVGGWFAYGTHDKNWKYGVYAELYADKYKEFTFRFDHKDDLQDPGRLQVNKELDRNFIRRFLLGRVDRIRSYTFGVNKRLGYFSLGAAVNVEHITPQYDYTFSEGTASWNTFKTKEIVLDFRYAYAERMSPMFGRYFSSGTKYPVLYSKIRFGKLENNDNRYVHAVAAVKWQKHLNHIGNEQFLLIGGGVFSKKP